MFFNNFFIKLIKNYQKNNSFKGRCRHYPCCSNYGIECFKKFNFFKASFLTGYRILRCNPLSKKVYDPVPLSKKEKLERKNKMSLFNEIEEILLYHHQQYPKMSLQDDLVIIFENTFLESSLSVDTSKLEKIGFYHYRIYSNERISPKYYNLSDYYDSTQLEKFFSQVEILKKLILKKKIYYPYSKNKLSAELFSYLSGKKAICHSDCYHNTYHINYIVGIVEKKDI